MGVANLTLKFPLDSKIDFIWKMNRWNWPIFCMLVQIHVNKSCLKSFGVTMVKNGCSQPGDGILKLAYLKNELME